jgi:hypothetical protein
MDRLPRNLGKSGVYAGQRLATRQWRWLTIIYPPILFSSKQLRCSPLTLGVFVVILPELIVTSVSFRLTIAGQELFSLTAGRLCMAIHIQVLAEMNERAAEDVARSLEQRFGEAGEASGEAFSRHLGQAFGGLSKDAQSAMDKMVKQADVAGAAIGAALISGTTAAVLGLEKIGDTFETINRGIMTTTAASGAALDELKSHADALVGSLDTSAAALGNTMGTLATRLRMTAGTELDTLTQHVTELSDRMGNINVGNFTAGLTQFHVDAGRADDTLASLLQTSREYAVGLPTLVDNLASFGVVLNSVHLNMEQSAHMMAEMTQAGIPLQQGLMGLEVAANAWSKPEVGKGRDYVTFIRDAAESMEYYDRIGNQVARDDIAVKIFGQRRWEQAEQGAQAFLDTIRQTPDAFKASGAGIDTFTDHTRTLHNVWQNFRNEMDVALQGPATGFIDELNEKMKQFGEWCQAHQQDLANLFHAAAETAGTVLTGLEKITEVLGSHPKLIEAVAEAFVTWKTITGINSVLTGLQGVLSLLRAIPGAVAGAGGAIGGIEAAGAGAAGAGAAEFAGLPAILNPATVGIAGGLALTGGVMWGANEYAKAHPESRAEMDARSGVPMGPMPGGATVIPGMGITLPGATGPGMLTAAPGDIPGMMLPTVAPPPAPTAPAAPGAPTTPGGVPPGLVTPDEFDPAKKGHKGPRLPVAPEVPYAPGFGDAPRPGESAKEYEHEQAILEARHKIDEDVARLNQLEADNNATADDIQKARNKLLHDQSDLYKTEERQTRSATEGLEQMGAKIDKDFGISKGLPGIAENLTKFLANLAMAPVMGALQGANAAIGGPTFGAHGGIGALALSGAFGPQFTPEGLEAAGASPWGGPEGRTHTGGRYGNQSEPGRTGGGGWAPSGMAGGRQGGPGGFLNDITAAAGRAAPSGMSGGGGAGGPSAVARQIYDAVLQAGYSPQTGLAAVAASQFESGLKPDQWELGGSDHFGLFQESGDKPRSGAAQQIQWFIGALNAAGGPGVVNADPANIIANRVEVGGYPGSRYNLPGAQAILGAQPPATPGGHVPGFDPSQVANGWVPHPPAPTAPALPGLPGSGRPGAPLPGDISGMMLPPAYAEGGATPPASLPGGGIPIIAHQNEHVLTSSDVDAMGGQSNVYAFRESLHPQPGGTGTPNPQPPDPPQPPQAPDAPRPGAPQINIHQPTGGWQPGPSMIGGMAPSAGYGSGFQVTGGGLVGVAESLPAQAVEAGIAAAEMGAFYGGAVPWGLQHYADGGDVTAAGPSGGGGSPGGAGGGGAPGGSTIGALIGIGMQEINEGISKGGQAAGALVGGLQQTFGPQQFAQSKQAQTGWLTKLVGGITGAQPQLPNTAGPKGGTPGLTPEQAASQQGGVGAVSNTVTNYGDGTNHGVIIENYHAGGDDERSVGWGIHEGYTAAINAQTGSR